MVARSDPLVVSDNEAIIGATAYPYTYEVLVEVTCRDAEEDLVVYSYAFEPQDEGIVRPHETVPDRHREVVVDALAEKNFEPTRDLTGAVQ